MTTTTVDSRIAGFRCWRATPDGTLLPQQAWTTPEDQARNHAWETNKATAVCTRPDVTGANNKKPPAHTEPHEDCRCGIHGLYTPQHETLNPYNPASILYLYGAMTAHGRTVLNQRGFRAQHAQAIALLHPDSYKQPHPTRAALIEAASHKYMLPLLNQQELIQYAALCGRLLVDPILMGA